MPRSGTKLLRGLLNEHSQVSIPLNETEFLPHWARRWKTWGDLSNPVHFQKFYDEVTRSVYFVHRHEEHGQRITVNDWHKSCEDHSLAGVFKALVTHDANACRDGIWGDKSPSYLTSLPLLKETFPTARFIHIIRDARDHCLSMKRAFGKSPIRAAQRWSDRIVAAKEMAANLNDDYVEVRYEDLLSNPVKELTTLCKFIGVEFESTMLAMSRAPENLGDTVGQHTIVAANIGKWRQEMSFSQRIQIERIAGSVLTELGYPVTESARIRVSKTTMFMLQIHDGFQIILRERAKRGWFKALAFRMRLFRQTRQQ